MKKNPPEYTAEELKLADKLAELMVDIWMEEKNIIHEIVLGDDETN